MSWLGIPLRFLRLARHGLARTIDFCLARGRSDDQHSCPQIANDRTCHSSWSFASTKAETRHESAAVKELGCRKTICLFLAARSVRCKVPVEAACTARFVSARPCLRLLGYCSYEESRSDSLVSKEAQSTPAPDRLCAAIWRLANGRSCVPTGRKADSHISLLDFHLHGKLACEFWP